MRHHSVADPDQAGGTRQVTTAVPASRDTSTRVIYCADGQVVPRLTSVLTGNPELEPPVLIGVHSDPLVRAQEYLSATGELFQVHEQFFVRHVRSWAAETLSVSVNGRQSAVFGFSNGGAFALAAALRHPEQFAAAIAFSVPPAGDFASVHLQEGPKPAIYLAAGNQGPEKLIRHNVLRLTRALRRSDVPVAFSEQHAGHDMNFWLSEFVSAVKWLKGITR